MKNLVLLSLFIWWITPIIANGQPTTITYQEDFSAFANPERGWYRSINPGYNDAPTSWLTVADLQALRNGADKITLIRKYYLLKDFRSSSIPQWYLDNVKADLQACRDAGVKLIPRFSYLWSLGVGPNADQDAPLNIVLQHLDQLEPIFNDYKDAIAWVQAGLVGKWGEWHSSSNNHVDNYTLQILAPGLQIRDKILAVVPADRFVAMRYFEHHKLPFWSEPLTQSQAYDGSAQARISTHHDRLMHEENWALPPCGSCPPYQEMKDYLMEDSKWALYEGEPESSGNYYKKNDPRVEFAELHMTAVANNANGTVHYDYWKSQGWYNGLTKHLGYRLKLTSATIDTQMSGGESFAVSLVIDNDGYASPVNARKFEIILRNTSDGSLHKTDVTNFDGVNTDPRYWLPGSKTVSLTIPVPSTLANGTYEVLVNLADPSPLLYNRAEYSIRLANQNVWESATGYNKLNHTITVGESTSPPDPTTGIGLVGEYFNNATLLGSVALTRTDPAVNFNWQSGAPDASLPANGFSVRWTGEVEAAHSETYTFYTRSDDGVRLWVNGQQLVNNWTNHGPTTNQGQISLQAGQKYSIRLEYYENAGGAVCQLRWSSASQVQEIVPQARLYPGSAPAPITTTYTARARGVQGTEEMLLQIGGQTVKTWTVSTTMQDYSYTGSESGNVRIAYTDALGSGHDLQVDKLTVDGVVYQAEAQAVNTAVWQNGGCGGSYSEWLHCNGYIQFAVNPTNARQAVTGVKTATAADREVSSAVIIYPNPSTKGAFTVSGVSEANLIQMFDIQGRAVPIIQHFVNELQVQVQSKVDLPQGLYVIRVRQPNGRQWQGKVMIE
ncbi:MAG: DUF4874 domain-containing protein [Tunicatimonas sp.]